MFSLIFFLAFPAFNALAGPVPTPTPTLHRQVDWQLPLLSFLDARRILTTSEAKPALTSTATAASPSSSSLALSTSHRVDDVSRPLVSPPSATLRIHNAHSSGHHSSPHSHTHHSKPLHPTHSRTATHTSTHHTSLVLHYHSLPIPIPFPHPFPPLPTFSRGLQHPSPTNASPSMTAFPTVIATATGNDTNDLSQAKKFRITLACVGSFALLVIFVLGFTAWRWRRKRLASTYSDDSLHPGAAMSTPEGHQPEDEWNSDIKNRDALVVENERGTLVLPQSLHDFSPSVSQVLRIGRSYDSVSASSSESVEIGRARAINYPLSHGSLNSSLAEDSRFMGQDGITEHSTRSPLDIDGGFAAELSFAFSIPSSIEHDFPTSPAYYSTSSSPTSLFASVRQARGVNSINHSVNHSTPVQSIRASIAEALSMISVPERLSGSAIMVDRKSLKSAKSTHSGKSSRFRFSHTSLSSTRRRRKSTTSVVTRSSSQASLPSPDPRDVAILFSGSQESIQFGMPSAPPTSFLGAPSTFLDPYIPHSPIFLPGTLMGGPSNPLEPSVFEPASASTPRRNRYSSRVLATPSRRHSSALKSSLMFDQSLSLLPPASPSSDGLSLIGGLGSSSDSMSSFGVIIPNRSDSSLPGRERTSPRGPMTPNSMEKSPPRVRVQPSPSPSPEKPKRSVLASLSMKSLVLKAAVDSLVADQFSPTHSDDKSINSLGRSVDRDDTLADGSDEKTRVSPPTVSVTDYDFSDSSMDITVAHQTADLRIDEIDGQHNSMGLPTSKSGHSLIIEDLLEKRGDVGTTLAEESSLDGMDDMCDDSLYPSVPVQTHPRFAIHRRVSSTLDVDEFSTQSIVIADVLEGQRDVAILAAESSLNGMGDLGDESLYSESDYVSTRPRVILHATRAASAEQSGITTSTNKLKKNDERYMDDKISPHGDAHSALSPPVSQPSRRLAVSVIPQLDDEMQHLEAMLMGVSSMEEVDLASLHGTLEDDESDAESFEGQLTDISRYHRTQFPSTHEDGTDDSNAEDNDWLRLPIHNEEYSAEYAYGDEGDDITYGLSLDYLSADTHPIVPRQAEVALRAIEREGGRAIEGEQIARHLDASRASGQKFAPAVSSPLRISHRLSMASVNSMMSNASDGSEYSQTSIAAAMIGMTPLRI